MDAFRKLPWVGDLALFNDDRASDVFGSQEQSQSSVPEDSYEYYADDQLDREDDTLDEFDRALLSGNLCMPRGGPDLAQPGVRGSRIRPAISDERQGGDISYEEEEPKVLRRQRLRPLENSYSDFSRNQQSLEIAPPQAKRIANESSTFFLPSVNRNDASSSSSPSCFPYSSPSLRKNQRREIQMGISVGDTPREDEICYPRSISSPNAVVNRSDLSSSMSTPIVQGIALVSTRELADRFRAMFPFVLFNAVQSKLFEKVFRTNENVVLSAPTGSGKTVILELAICRLISEFQPDQCKIVYMAPTKSLCSERQRDWSFKFKSIGLRCEELTGDTDHTQLKHVQTANVIVTTPEKWDATTRKWRDHARLMQLIKLFLVDEVHILNETRGSSLEAVISRMKSIGPAIRFIALSATIPNSEDIASWLGLDSERQRIPAHREVFGEELRPVKLERHVYGISYRGNDFGLEGLCDEKLPAVITKHSARKPILIFCCTRSSAQATAKKIAQFWSKADIENRPWDVSANVPTVADYELQRCIASGVAFHHAGVDLQSRATIESSFLERRISVICCTTTLAVGVNFPCHLVIIKNTVCWQDSILREYTDLEIMQMLGRAGRPQFDKTAVAIIITRQEKVAKYEKLVSGQEPLESSLHHNLIEHLNAEIGLGTIHDLATAKTWLKGTFLFIRLRRNLEHYKLSGDSHDGTIDERVERICNRDILVLQESHLIHAGSRFRCTEFGQVMARYYVKLSTMKRIMELSVGAKMSEMITALAQADEFHEVRFRAGEKALYKFLNSHPSTRFPTKVDIATSPQKRSLIIQSELGCIDFPTEDQFLKHKRQYYQDKALIFIHMQRLVRNSLELSRSLSAHVWENSPLQLKQIDDIGPVKVRRLMTAGINSFEALQAADPQRLNMLLSKNPPFGQNIIQAMKEFPKPLVTLKMIDTVLKNECAPVVKFRVELGFINGKCPSMFQRKRVFVCFMAERSDGLLIDFKRMSAKAAIGETFNLSTEVLDESHFISCHIACDELAGTSQQAQLRFSIPAKAFSQVPRSYGTRGYGTIHASRAFSSNPAKQDLILRRDDFSDSGLSDNDLVDAVEHCHRETGNTEVDIAQANPTSNEVIAFEASTDQVVWQPKRLDNGKWECNHHCKDKKKCKHLCCRDGVDKAPVRPPRVINNPSKKRPGLEHADTSLEEPAKVTAQKISVPYRSNSNMKDSITSASIEPGLSRRRSQNIFPIKATKSAAPELRSASGILSAPRAQWAKPRTEFLNQSHLGERSEDGQPGDWDGGLVDDLPPPSVLLRGVDHEDRSPQDPIDGLTGVAHSPLSCSQNRLSPDSDSLFEAGSRKVFDEFTADFAIPSQHDAMFAQKNEAAGSTTSLGLTDLSKDASDLEECSVTKKRRLEPAV